jgi:DNA-binding response OmpR family regulator
MQGLPMCHHILVVEDDHSLRPLMRELLEDEGYTVETAEHGAAALEQMQHRWPRLILLDLMMPVMDGVTFLNTLAGLGWRASVPILVLSAAHLPPHKVEALGVDLFCPKPCPVDDLLANVARLARPPP